jgi:hypothetical protein
MIGSSLVDDTAGTGATAAGSGDDPEVAAGIGCSRVSVSKWLAHTGGNCIRSCCTLELPSFKCMVRNSELG